MLLRNIWAIVLNAFILIFFANILNVNAATIQSQPPGEVASAAEIAKASQNGIYVGGGVSYNWADWAGTRNAANGDNNENSLLYAGYFGYQYNQNYASEAGFFLFPNIGGVKIGSTAARGTVKSYVLYTALKMIQPIYKKLNVFTKAGIAYQSYNLDGDASTYGPLFSLGIDYVLNRNFSFDFSYNYLKGDGSFNSGGILAVPKSNMLMLSMNYNLSR